MKSFEYKHARSLKEAQKLSASDWSNTQFYAGGTDQLSLLKHEIITPQRLINLKTIEGLNTISTHRDFTEIGALVTLSEIIKHQEILKRLPVIAKTAGLVASPQLRNVATIAGNLCQRPRCWYFRGDFDCLRKSGDICYAVGGENKYHCIIGGDPCFIVHPSDMAVCLMALDSNVVIYDKNKERMISLDDFFILPEENPYRENILEPNQIITSVHVPHSGKGIMNVYEKVRERQSWDFPIVSVAMSLQLDGNLVKKGKIVLGGVAPKPWTEKSMNDDLKDLKLNKKPINDFSNTILKDADVMDQNDYKVQMARNLVQHMLQSAGQS